MNVPVGTHGKSWGYTVQVATAVPSYELAQVYMSVAGVTAEFWPQQLQGS